MAAGVQVPAAAHVVIRAAAHGAHLRVAAMAIIGEQGGEGEGEEEEHQQGRNPLDYWSH